jgi:hypothetical protein
VVEWLVGQGLAVAVPSPVVELSDERLRGVRLLVG